MAVADTIPARFRGVWDNAEGTCAPASDLRMDIRAGEIEFYESLGEVTSVETEGPDSIVVSLAISAVVAAGLALWCWVETQSIWNTALFGLLAYQSYETMQQYRASRGGW